MSQNIYPEKFKTFFWDTDLKNLDLEKHKTFIIERLLFIGDFPEVRWLLKEYGIEQIREIVKISRVLDSPTKNFYLNVYK